MKSVHPLASAVRIVLGSLTAALAVPALAQDTGDIEEIVITGSRITRSNLDSPSPIISFNRDDIDRSGYANLQQMMEKLPVAGNGTFSTRGNNQDSTANGTAAISLRGLGADATLVLVNGRRVQMSPFAQDITTNFVDINSIPVAAIERVEVLKDGASAVYGSDAVAGVVNVVLRRDFEGFELSGSYGDASGDMNEKNLSAIWGINGEDSNITLVYDYYSNSTLENRERGTLDSANQSGNGGEDFRSSRSSPGRYTVGGATTIDPACPADRVAGQTCLFDYGPYNLLEPESDRMGLLINGYKGLGGGIELFTEMGVQHNESIARGAPAPLDSGAGLSVPWDHPDNPFTRPVGDTSSSFDIQRYRTVDAGPRRWDIESDTLRGVFGLRGELAESWKWEVAAQWARSKSQQTGDRGMGWVRTDFLQQEISAGRYNPFGLNSDNPQSVIDAIQTSLVRRGESHMKGVDLSLNGELFEMSGGVAKMAAGVEYREEDVDDQPDDQFVRGLIYGTEAVSASADREITSAYAEFLLPLFAGFEVSLAGRYDDYSDFGDTWNPKIAARWAPIDTLALRASWGTGFRAPSLAQIGLGPSQESQFFVDNYRCAEHPGDPNYCTALDNTLVFGGNPDLDAEDSESFNLGIQLEPIEQLSIAVDWWRIEQENKIDEVSFGYIYNQNCNVQNSAICSRLPPLAGDTLGELDELQVSFVNIGEQNAEGVDFGAYYDMTVADGDLRIGLDYTYLLDFERVELDATGTGFDSRSLAGEYEYPEHRWAFNADWGNDLWGIHSVVTYVGEFEDTPDIDFDGTLDYDQYSTPKVDAFVTWNLQFRFTGIEKTVLSLGADNVLDEDPPFAVGDGDADLYGYVSSQHSPRGRFIYARVNYRF